MLRYLNSGTRKFGIAPMRAHRRLNWEFYAVLKGCCGVLLPGERREPLRSSHLWLFPPRHEHGWHGDRKACSIVAFHFGSVPDVVQQFAAGKPYLERAVTAEEVRTLAGLARQLRAPYLHRAELSPIYFQRALLDLTILILGEELRNRRPEPGLETERKVNAAMSWYREHLLERPSLEAMAAAVHLSPGHLRRLFVMARGQSPHEAVTGLKLEAAQRLLSETDLKLNTVAVESGFSSATDLCRNFKARLGCSPGQWRETIPPPFETHPESRGLAVADYEI